MSSSSRAQQAEAPIYRDGDWWKVKVQATERKGQSLSACDVNYPEYMVRISQGKPRVYGLKETNETEISCPIVALRLLGGNEKESQESSSDSVEDDDRGIQYLKFPLTVGAGWVSSMPEARKTKGKKNFRTVWLELQYQTVAWEKISVAGKSLDAFKIEVSRWPHGPFTYYYAPDARAIVHLRLNTANARRTISLVDFGTSQ
jgi:hypothetical protein